MTALLLGALAPIASAATEHPNGCPPDNTYSVSNAVGAFVPDAAKKVYGQSGVTLSINAAAGTTWTGTVGGSASGDIDAIIASAQATVSSSISWSKTTTVTLGGSWTVPSSQKTGWLALGSQGYSMHWQVAGYTGGCVYKVLRSGSAALPALTPMLAHS
ncbi:hypothetical protein BCF44_109234 [Kutzneria buriramensis]|uniref:Uncharacterized protein n=2 Tax=Kutzneria buriramensis TaxID=1045776 RepID=A0A3E0HEJ3_9PSEU|nr:hypothetical protein BCF44_109234 [Kutzneria buriramensis]